MSYTDEELAGLSAEERAALADDGVDEDALKRIVGEDGDPEPGVGDVAKAGDVVGPKDADEVKPVDVPADPVVDAPKEDVAAFMPEYKVPEVADYAAKMADFASQKAALRVTLNDGDLTHEEYDAKKDAIVAAEQDLRELKLKSEIATEQNEQNAIARWNWEQERFFGDEANAVYKDKYLLAAFDAAVRDLGSNAANANRPGHWFLQEADKLVRARFNTGEVKDPAPKPKVEPRKPDLSMVPKTLAHLPAAEIQQIGEVDEFAHIDRLSGLELEKALGRLSDVERERYRASA